jgi:glycosyltransferase involved in cell wall biosynthesis
MEAALTALASQLGLAHKVQFLGWKSNPYQWMIRSDLFVLSSRWEAWPVVMLEALALGLPIVATDCAGASARILDNGKCGRLVPPESPDALAAAIDQMLSKESLRQQFSRVSGIRAAEFGLPMMISRYDQLLREVMATG